VENRHLGRQVACGRCQKTILLPSPADVTTPPATQGNEHHLRSPSRKIIVAAALTAGVLLLLAGAAGLRLAFRPAQRADRPAQHAEMVETPNGGLEFGRLETELQDALSNEVRDVLGKADAEIDCTIFRTDFWNKKHRPLPGVTIPSFSLLWVYHRDNGRDLLVWLVPDSPAGGVPCARRVLLVQHAGTVADLEQGNRDFQESMKNAQKQNGLEGLNPRW
jgi:hypothetical protein